MDKRTKFKVTLIIVMGALVVFIYGYHEQILNGFKFAQSEKEWQKQEPKGKLINGKKNGEWTTYFKNGQLAIVENYRNDTLHGKQLCYTPDGHYNSRASYNMGVKVDSFFIYDGNGRLNLFEFNDSTGKHQGPFIVYHTNGQIIQTGNYKDGKFDGEFKTFFRTGQLKTIEHFKLNEPTGKWIELSDKGDTIKVDHF